jgi:hypothetical protein
MVIGVMTMLPQPANDPCFMMGTMRGANTPAVRPYGRLKLVGAGAVLAFVGAARMARGVQVVTHWTGQPMFSWGLVGAGGLCIVLAFIPPSWIAKAATTHSKTHRGAFS